MIAGGTMNEVTTQAPDAPEVGLAGAPAGAAVGGTGNDARVSSYAELFDRTARVAHAGEPAWLGALRRGAIERFAQLGFPTTKNEDWHFTSVAPIAARAFAPRETRDAYATVTAGQLAPFLFAGDWHVVVFVNGHFAPELSGFAADADTWHVAPLTAVIPDGPRAVQQLLGGIAPYQENAFTALNTAFLQDGAFVAAKPNAVIAKPIHVLHVAAGDADGALVSPRTLITADHHAEVTVVESYVSLGTGAYFTNAVSEVYVAPGARVRHYKVQRENEASYHVASWYVHQQQDSHYESFSFAVGADLSRTNVSTVLDGPGAHATLNGLYMVTGSQTVDHQTRIEHAKENCTSHEVYKGILDGESHAVFNGKVFVRPEAQKTDGKQSNNNLLLSDAARVDTKPQLEIFADDVKCTHGATVGRLDPTSLFYLKSRGVGTEMARRLMTYAFAADVLEELTVDPVRARLEELTFARFGIAG